MKGQVFIPCLEYLNVIFQNDPAIFCVYCLALHDDDMVTIQT